MPIKAYVKKIINPFFRKRRTTPSIDMTKLIHSNSFTILQDDISPNTIRVIHRLQKAGYMAFLVGGSVRDLLLRKSPKDFDIATDAKPEEIRTLFRNCRLIGRRFRLAHVHFGREIVEVATFRAHAIEHNDHQFSKEGIIVRDNVYGTIQDDAWRRDFTINALYYDINQNNLVDYTQGFQDLQQRLIRIIGDPLKRYREDPVRMIRAIRFSAKLNFTIESNTESAIYKCKNLLQHISSSRLYEEVLKLFLTGHGVKSYQLLVKYKLFELLFPQTQLIADTETETNNQLITFTLINTDERVKLQKPLTPAFLFAALLWHPVNIKLKSLHKQGIPLSLALDRAISHIVSIQRKSVSIPKRLIRVIREIYSLQYRLSKQRARKAYQLLSHPRFRAGYDFLCIRANSGEIASEIAEWWTKFQSADAEMQKQMLIALKE